MAFFYGMKNGKDVLQSGCISIPTRLSSITDHTATIQAVSLFLVIAIMGSLCVQSLVSLDNRCADLGWAGLAGRVQGRRLRAGGPASRT